MIALLFDLFTNPESLCQTMELLETLGQRKELQGNSHASLADLSFFEPPEMDLASLSSGMKLMKMVFAAGQAHDFISKNRKKAEEAKFKTILDYLNIYLTMKFGVVPAIKALHTEWTDHQVDSAKLAYLQDLIYESEGVKIEDRALENYVRYGKVYWKLTKACGVLVLVLLAVGGPGVTVIARKNGMQSNHIPLLGYKLRNNVVWLSACQAWGPVAVEIIFTNSQRHYTKTEMLTYLIAQPLPAKFLGGFHKEYLGGSNSVIPISEIGSQINRASLTLNQAAEALSIFNITLCLAPPDKYAASHSKRVKLVDWLLSLESNKIVVPGLDPYAYKPQKKSILLTEFHSFLEPNSISDVAVGLLSASWNQYALPGWACIPPTNAARFMNKELGLDLAQAAHTAVGERRFGIPYTHFIFPLTTANKVFGLHLSLTQHLATLYTWTPHQEDLDGNSLQVFNVSFSVCLY